MKKIKNLAVIALSIFMLVSCGEENSSSSKDGEVPPSSVTSDSSNDETTTIPSGEETTHEVNETIWKDSFEKLNNITLVGTKKEDSSNVRVLEVTENALKMTSGNYVSITSKESDGTYRYDYISSEDLWRKTKTDDDFDLVFENYTSMLAFGDSYSSFTFDSVKGVYSAATVTRSIQGTIHEFNNVEVSFENGNIKSVVFDIEESDVEVHYVCDKVGETVVTFPDESKIKKEQVAVDETTWKAAFANIKNCSITEKDDFYNKDETEPCARMVSETKITENGFYIYIEQPGLKQEVYVEIVDDKAYVYTEQDGKWTKREDETCLDNYDVYKLYFDFNTYYSSFTYSDGIYKANSITLTFNGINVVEVTDVKVSLKENQIYSVAYKYQYSFKSDSDEIINVIQTVSVHDFGTTSFEFPKVEA